MSQMIDMTGQRFGILTVIDRAASKPGDRNALWRCLCDCGNERVATGSALRRGYCVSCGCLRRKNMELQYIRNDPDWKKKKETKKSIPCPYNEVIECTSMDCWRCGWNHKVAQARTEKFMEGYNGNET